MSMHHHWAELDALLAELDEAERFRRARPRLTAVAERNQARETEAPAIADSPSATDAKR